MTRRGYDVALTLSRTPKVDLLCSAPEGKQFRVQVKGMRNRNGPWIQPHFFNAPADPQLFLITVNVPSGDKEPFEFFIMTHRDAKAAWRKRKRPIRQGFEGFNYKEIEDYKDKWQKLPNV